MFGNNKPAFGGSSSFGSPGTSLFGNQSKPSGSLFGQTANTGSSLFGQKSTTNLFGSPSTQANTGSIFGGTQQNASSGSSLFGQSKPSMFGNTNTASNTFGTSSSSGGLFGNTSSNTSGGLFGASSSTASNAPNGTTIKFNPPVSIDTMNKGGSVANIQTKHFCITAMKEYDSKSLEELRVDDYIANRKTPSTSGGLFGASSTNTGSSLFGSSNQQKPSLFGSTTANASFGSTTNQQSSSLFGGSTNNNNNTGSSLFGAKPASTGLFGSTNTQQQNTSFGSSSFGATTNNAFGANNNNQSSSVFGNSSFGQNTSQTNTGGGLFGASANTNTFGSTNTGGGLFGGATTTNQSSGSLFGAKPATTQSSGFNFGGSTTTTNAFGSTNTGGGLFGSNTAAKPGGLFGSTTTTNTGGSLFGNTAQPAQTGGLFGSTQPTQQAGGLFGGNAAQNTSAVVQNPATVSVSAPVIVLGSDVNETQVKMAMINAQLAASPYGNSPLLKLTSEDTDEKPNPISVSRQMRFLAAKANAPNSPLNTHGNNTSLNTSANSSTLKTSFLSGQAPVAGSKLRRSNVPVGQDLNYKSTRKPPTLGNGLRDKGNGNVSLNDSSLNISRSKISDVDLAVEKALSTNDNNIPGSRKKSNIKFLDLNSIRKSAVNSSPKNRTADPDELPAYDDGTVEIASPSSNPRDAALQREEALRREPPRLVLDNSSLDESALMASQESQNSDVVNGEARKSTQVTSANNSVAAAGVTLLTSDYYCEPTIKEMSNMVVNGKVVIPNGLTIGRASYGSVFWPGRVELSNIVLDEIVIFRHKEVTVYPDDSKKPALGEELNKEAEVTLERVWHVDKQTKEEIRDPLVLADIGWRDRLERVTAKMGAIFKDYRPASGSWVFKVEHFSKYGLPDNEGADILPDVPPVKDPVLAERNLQAKVQRASLHMDNSMDMNESGLEIEGDENRYTAKMPSNAQTTVGLGGVANRTFNLSCFLDDTVNSFDQAMDVQVPPEKKLKLEETEVIYEEAKKLMEILSPCVRTYVKPAPKTISPVKEFTGGCPAKKSARTNASTCIDLAATHSAVSRVGWSSGGRYVVSLQPKCNSVYVKSLNWGNDDSQNYISDMLEHNMRLSQFIRRNRSISAKVRHYELEGQEISPRIKPTADHAELIDSFLATSMQSGFDADTRVWKLCKALFPQNRDNSAPDERIEALSTWLREEVQREKQPHNEIGRGANVWIALCEGNIEKAVDAAINENLHTLASYLTLIQLNCSERLSVSKFFGLEIDCLERKDECKLSTPMLKIYIMFSGKSSITRNINGKTEIISCLDGLTWKQAIGLHVWWLRGSKTLESSLINAFSSVFNPKSCDDILYHNIMSLACDQTHRIECVLDAADMVCDNPLDFHLSWHLWSVLRSIGYNTMSPEAEQRLHSQYSEQLIASGLPNLALFVLSHVSNNQCRASLMRECLERISMFTTTSQYEKMSKGLDIPKIWIAEARFIAAYSCGNFEQACEFALKAGDLQTAHKLFIDEVAPHAVVVGDIERLSNIVKKFMPHTDNILAWGQNGQLYADYAEFKTLNDDEEDHLLLNLINSIESRLKAPVFHSPIQRLSAQNIALEIFEAQKVLGNLPLDLPLNSRHVEKVTKQVI